MRLRIECPNSNVHSFGIVFAQDPGIGGKALSTNPAKEPSASRDLDLQQLIALFPADGDVPAFRHVDVAACAVPAPYWELLVHEHHMTVTVEAYHGGPVDVRVLAQRQEGESYARQILLVLRETGHVVQYGIMRINLRFCGPELRAAIVAGKTPLGRILIEHGVMRRIEPQRYLHVTPGPAMMKWFGLTKPLATYGRLALIHCNGQSAVELLEIVAPESTDKRK